MRRFPTGLAHYVFDVASVQIGAVVRLAATRRCEAFTNAVYWSELLRPMGVPLPRLLEAGSCGGFDYLVLERLPGTDLTHVYDDLSPGQKRGIATGVVAAQARVRGLAAGSGYGYASTLTGPFRHRTWREVVSASVGRSRLRIGTTRVIDPAICDRIERQLDTLEPYLRQVPPRPFLDDTTTKNVICDAGQLSGIVDVDGVCFGDPLFTPALTRAALLADGRVPDYVSYWLEQLAPDDGALQAFHLYTAVFCLDLISEAGQKFNRETAEPVDGERVRRLWVALNDNLD